MKFTQLLILHSYMLTLGRIPFFAHLMRRALVRLLVKKKNGRTYHASAGFFQIRDLG